MALAKQELVIPLGVGMNEGVPRELLPVGQLHDVQNGRLRKPGKLEKRYGYELVAGGIGTTTAGTTLSPFVQRLLKRDDELAIVSGNNQLASYSSSRDQWAIRGTAPEVQAHKRFTAVQAYAQGNITGASTARIGDYLAVCWEGSVSIGVAVFCRVFDLRTGSIVSEVVETAGPPGFARVIAVGNYFVAAWRSGGGSPFG